jgi:hypothetical protein
MTFALWARPSYLYYGLKVLCYINSTLERKNVNFFVTTNKIFFFKFRKIHRWDAPQLSPLSTELSVKAKCESSLAGYHKVPNLMCKTPDFHRKSESLYHRDSLWISGYRVQNVSQIDTQSHTSHHNKLIAH